MSNPNLISKAIYLMLLTCAFILNVPLANANPTSITTSGNCELALELSLNQQDTSPRQYTFYTVEAILDNVGLETISDILIDFSKPEGVVYKGDDPFGLSHGSFTPHGSQEWKIDDLAPGERATLTVNYFLLWEEAPTVEIDLVSCSGDSGFRFGDLTISGLRVQNPELRPGDVLNYNFDLSNIGEGDVTRDFSVKSWISIDPNISNDDVQDGFIPTGNFASRFEVPDVPGSSTIPENIAPGEYVLIVKIDGDDEVFETNESNNTVMFGITVLEDTPSETMSMPTECTSDLIFGNFLCSNFDTNGELVILTTAFGDIIENRVNSLEQIESEIIGSHSTGVSYKIAQNVFTKFVDQVVEFEVPVPEELSSEFSLIRTAIEFEDGFLILGFPYADDGTRSFEEVYAIVTDEDLLPIRTNFIAEGIGNGVPTGISSFIPIPNDRFMFTLVRGLSPHSELYRIIFDSDLNLVEEVLLEDKTANTVTGGVGQQACGNYRQSTSVNLFGAYSRIEDTFFTIVNNVFETQSKITRTSKSNRPAPSTLTERFSFVTSDGGTIDASHQQTNVGAIGTNVKIERRTADFELIYEYIIQVENPYLIVNIIEFDGRPMLIVEQSGGGISILDIECLRDSEEETNNVDVNLDVVTQNSDARLFTHYEITYLLFNEGEEVVTNIVVDVPLPEAMVYTGGAEYDTNSGEFSPYGDQKWKVDEIAPGEKLFLTLSYFILQSGEFLNYAEIAQMDQEDADSTPGNGACCTTNEDDEVFFIQVVQGNNTSNAVLLDEIPNYSVELRSISPNPTFPGPIEVEIYSAEEETRALQCFNATGLMTYSFDVHLTSGWNKVPLDVSDLVAGTYIMHLAGLNLGQPPVRFVVVTD